MVQWALHEEHQPGLPFGLFEVWLFANAVVYSGGLVLRWRSLRAAEAFVSWFTLPYLLLLVMLLSTIGLYINSYVASLADVQSLTSAVLIPAVGLVVARILTQVSGRGKAARWMDISRTAERGMVTSRTAARGTDTNRTAARGSDISRPAARGTDTSLTAAARGTDTSRTIAIEATVSNCALVLAAASFSFDAPDCDVTSAAAILTSMSSPGVLAVMAAVDGAWRRVREMRERRRKYIERRVSIVSHLLNGTSIIVTPSSSVLDHQQVTTEVNVLADVVTEVDESSADRDVMNAQDVRDDHEPFKTSYQIRFETSDRDPFETGDRDPFVMDDQDPFVTDDQTVALLLTD